MGSIFVKPCCPHQLSLLPGESRWSDLRDLDVDSRFCGRCQGDKAHARPHWSLLRALFILHESGVGARFLSISLCNWLGCASRGKGLFAVLLLVVLSAPAHAAGGSLWDGF